MKTKIPFLTICLLLLFQANAQELFKDDFSQGIPVWTAEGDFPENLKLSETDLAGGASPELHYKGKFPVTASNKNCRIVSPAIDLSKYPGQNLMLHFCHKVDYVSSIDLSLVTTSDGGGTWNDVWRGSQDFEQQMFVRIDNSDIGAAQFRFAFTCSGNFQQLKDWYIDNVVLSVEADDNAYLETMACEEESVTLKEENTVSLSFKNLGKKNITSVEMCYQIDNDEMVMEIRTGLNIAHFERSSLTFQQPIVGKTIGEHSVKAWIAKVNGAPIEKRVLSDSFTVTDIPLPPVKKAIMIEEFTSSTCAPCAVLNAILDPWLQTSRGDVVATKYQMFFPQPITFPNGDPYFIEDCELRSEFYGSIRAVPTPFMDGTEFPSASTHEERVKKAKELAQELLKQPGKVDIKATFNITGQTIKIEIHLMPYVSGEYLLNVSVNEKTTTENVGTNGESAFHSVLMKMLPDGNGQKYTFTEGKPVSVITFESNLSDTHIEEFDDLEVAVFVQEPVSRAVLNAVYATETTISPNPPVKLKATVEGTKATLSWEKPSPGTGLGGYTLYRDGVLVKENITGTSYLDEDLPNDDYTYHLKVVYPEMESVYASCSATVDVSISAPTHVVVTTEDDKIFNITWNASPEEYVAGYDIYRDGTKVNQELVESASYVDEAPYEGGYCYRVVAIAPMGESQPSAKACAGLVAIEDVVVDNSLKVYPNPTEGALRITNNESPIKLLQLFDLNGRLLYEKDHVGTTEYTIDISGFMHGVYILNVDGKSVKIIKK